MTIFKCAAAALIVLAPVALALVVAEECRFRRWLRQAKRETRERTGLEEGKQ